jgi:hypothetical protein
MKNIKIERQNINIAALDATIRAAFGEQVSGISTGPYGVMIHMADDVTPAQIEQTRQIVADHDETVQTPEQSAAKLRHDAFAKLSGKALDKLTLPEIKSILAVLWHDAGIIDDDGNIRLPNNSRS